MIYYSLTCDSCFAYHTDAETGSVIFNDQDTMVSQAKSYGWSIEASACFCYSCIDKAIPLKINKPAAVTAGL